MKMLHVVSSYLPATRYGGPIYAVHGLCKALVALGVEVHVYTTNIDGDGVSLVPLNQAIDMDGVKIWYFSSPALKRLYWAPTMIRHLRRTIQEFDVVHLHSVFLWPTWAAARMARANDVPYIVTPRGMLVEKLVRKKSFLAKTLWIKLIERCNVEKASAVHVTSSVERDELTKFAFDLPPVTIVPNGVDMPLASDKALTANVDVEALIDDRPIILYIGRLHWKKGLDLLVESMCQVSDGHLIIAGNDEEAYALKLERLVRKYSLSEKVSILPRMVTDIDKERLFQAAQVFALTSRSENFGNTVMEAMVRGVPVLTTLDVGAATIVQDANAGLICECHPDSIAAALKNLLNDHEGRQRMSVSGRYCAEKYYLWVSVASKMLETYKNALNYTPKTP